MVKQIRLLFSGPSGYAAEVQQGMMCELEVQVEQQVEQQSPRVQAGQQAKPKHGQRVAPGDWVLDATKNVLTADLQLAVQYQEDIAISTVGTEYGPGDAVYLASWGTGKAVREHDLDSFFLSYGSFEADICMVHLLLVPTPPEGMSSSACCTAYEAQHHCFTALLTSSFLPMSCCK